MTVAGFRRLLLKWCSKPDHHLIQRRLLMHMNRVIDQYTLEAEILFENENTPLPVRWIATNTDDKSTAETWMNIGQSRVLLEFVFGEHANGQWEILQEHRHLELMADAKTRCILNSHDLLRFGFVTSELRPWKIEKAPVA
jgi:hypothetical protein